MDLEIVVSKQTARVLGAVVSQQTICMLENSGQQADHLNAGRYWSASITPADVKVNKPGVIDSTSIELSSLGQKYTAA